MNFIGRATSRFQVSPSDLAASARDAASRVTGPAESAFERARGRAQPLASRLRASIGGARGVPNIGVDTSTTAVAVADAAKRTMLERIDEVGLELAVIRETAYEAVMEASEAGVDVTAAAVGSVAGVVDMAHTLGADAGPVANAAAEASVAAAASVGEVAAERVREAIKRRARKLRLSI